MATDKLNGVNSDLSIKIPSQTDSSQVAFYPYSNGAMIFTLCIIKILCA